jgi:hypothetical protein
MSQPYQSQAPEQPVLAPGGRARLWCAPRGLTGLQLRTALSGRLPAEQRLAVLGVALLIGIGGGAAAGAADEPALVGFVVAAVVVAVGAFCRWALARKRRSHGLVQVTPLQFDLIVALDQLSADRIDAGRQLHDRLVWLLQQPTRDTAAVQQCEYWMWQLVTGQ